MEGDSVKHKKKALAMLLALVLLIAAVGGTLALFTREARSTNVITTGTVQMTLTEESGDGVFYEDKEAGVRGLKFENVMPGQELKKQPIVTNTGNQDFWLRVRIEKHFDNGQLSADVITTDMDTEKWLYNEKDGWYYWNAPVEPEEEVVVFNTVTFDKAMGNEYQNESATVTIQAQAVQKANNPMPEEGIFGVKGWPAASAE